MPDYSQIKTMYEDQFLTIGEISKKVGVSRNMIHMKLRQVGVNTIKRQYEVECSCGCGKTLFRPRCYIRDHRYIFFDKSHHLRAIKKYNLPEIYKAHAIAKIIFQNLVGTLDFDPVIYFADGNFKNVSDSNLWGFKTKKDLFAFEKGGAVMVLKADTGKWEEVKKWKQT